MQINTLRNSQVNGKSTCILCQIMTENPNFGLQKHNTGHCLNNWQWKELHILITGSKVHKLLATERTKG